MCVCVCVCVCVCEMYVHVFVCAYMSVYTHLGVCKLVPLMYLLYGQYIVCVRVRSCDTKGVGCYGSLVLNRILV